MPSNAAQAKGKTNGSGAKSEKESSNTTREAYVTPHFGDLGVDLPVMRVTQRLEKGRWLTDI
jgi:ATP-dependent RNA helicase DHX37/DHR1